MGLENYEFKSDFALRHIEHVIEQGRERGRRVVADALCAMLTLKFGGVPAVVSERIEAAAFAELERWVARVVEARSLDGVFEEPEGA